MHAESDARDSTPAYGVTGLWRARYTCAMQRVCGRWLVRASAAASPAGRGGAGFRRAALSSQASWDDGVDDDPFMDQRARFTDVTDPTYRSVADARLGAMYAERLRTTKFRNARELLVSLDELADAWWTKDIVVTSLRKLSAFANQGDAVKAQLAGRMQLSTDMRLLAMADGTSSMLGTEELGAEARYAHVLNQAAAVVQRCPGDFSDKELAALLALVKPAAHGADAAFGEATASVLTRRMLAAPEQWPLDKLASLARVASTAPGTPLDFLSTVLEQAQDRLQQVTPGDRQRPDLPTLESAVTLATAARDAMHFKALAGEVVPLTAAALLPPGELAALADTTSEAVEATNTLPAVNDAHTTLTTMHALAVNKLEDVLADASTRALVQALPKPSWRAVSRTGQVDTWLGGDVETPASERASAQLQSLSNASDMLDVARLTQAATAVGESAAMLASRAPAAVWRAMPPSRLPSSMNALVDLRATQDETALAVSHAAGAFATHAAEAPVLEVRQAMQALRRVMPAALGQLAAQKAADTASDAAYSEWQLRPAQGALQLLMATCGRLEEELAAQLAAAAEPQALSAHARKQMSPKALAAHIDGNTLHYTRVDIVDLIDACAELHGTLAEHATEALPLSLPALLETGSAIRATPSTPPTKLLVGALASTHAALCGPLLSAVEVYASRFTPQELLSVTGALLPFAGDGVLEVTATAAGSAVATGPADVAAALAASYWHAGYASGMVEAPAHPPDSHGHSMSEVSAPEEAARRLVSARSGDLEAALADVLHASEDPDAGARHRGDAVLEAAEVRLQRTLRGASAVVAERDALPFFTALASMGVHHPPLWSAAAKGMWEHVAQWRTPSVVAFLQAAAAVPSPDPAVAWAAMACADALTPAHLSLYRSLTGQERAALELETTTGQAFEEASEEQVSSAADIAQLQEAAVQAPAPLAGVRPHTAAFVMGLAPAAGAVHPPFMQHLTGLALEGGAGPDDLLHMAQAHAQALQACAEPSADLPGLAAQAAASQAAADSAALQASVLPVLAALAQRPPGDVSSLTQVCLSLAQHSPGTACARDAMSLLAGLFAVRGGAGDVAAALPHLTQALRAWPASDQGVLERMALDAIGRVDLSQEACWPSVAECLAAVAESARPASQHLAQSMQYVAGEILNQPSANSPQAASALLSFALSSADMAARQAATRASTHLLQAPVSPESAAHVQECVFLAASLASGSDPSLAGEARQAAVRSAGLLQSAMGPAPLPPLELEGGEVVKWGSARAELRGVSAVDLAAVFAQLALGQEPGGGQEELASAAVTCAEHRLQELHGNSCALLVHADEVDFDHDDVIHGLVQAAELLGDMAPCCPSDMQARALRLQAWALGQAVHVAAAGADLLDGASDDSAIEGEEAPEPVHGKASDHPPPSIFKRLSSMLGGGQEAAGEQEPLPSAPVGSGVESVWSVDLHPTEGLLTLLPLLPPKSHSRGAVLSTLRERGSPPLLRKVPLDASSVGTLVWLQAALAAAGDPAAADVHRTTELALESDVQVAAAEALSALPGMHPFLDNPAPPPAVQACVDQLHSLLQAAGQQWVQGAGREGGPLHEVASLVSAGLSVPSPLAPQHALAYVQLLEEALEEHLAQGKTWKAPAAAASTGASSDLHELLTHKVPGNSHAATRMRSLAKWFLTSEAAQRGTAEAHRNVSSADTPVRGILRPWGVEPASHSTSPEQRALVAVVQSTRSEAGSLLSADGASVIPDALALLSSLVTASAPAAPAVASAQHACRLLLPSLWLHMHDGVVSVDGLLSALASLQKLAGEGVTVASAYGAHTSAPPADEDSASQQRHHSEAEDGDWLTLTARFLQRTLLQRQAAAVQRVALAGDAQVTSSLSPSEEKRLAEAQLLWLPPQHALQLLRSSADAGLPSAQVRGVLMGVATGDVAGDDALGTLPPPLVVEVLQSVLGLLNGGSGVQLAQEAGGEVGLVLRAGLEAVTAASSEAVASAHLVREMASRPHDAEEALSSLDTLRSTVETSKDIIAAVGSAGGTVGEPALQALAAAVAGLDAAADAAGGMPALLRALDTDAQAPED